MEDRVKRPLAAALGCGVGFAALASLAHGDAAFGRLDARLVHRFARHDNGTVGDLAGAVVHLGDPLPQALLAATAVGVGLARRRPRRALAALVVVAGANVSTQLLKRALAQPRYQPLLGWHQIGATSFPSGHATAVSALAFAFALVVPAAARPLVAVLGAGALAAVGAATLVVHWHYASDVAGGVLVSGFWFFATVAAGRALGLGAGTGTVGAAAAARLPLGQRDRRDVDLLDGR